MYDQENTITVTRKPSDQVTDATDGSLGAAVPHLIRFVLLLATWLLLSGMFDPFHIGLGMAASAFVTWLSANSFPPEAGELRSMTAVGRLLAYIPWLILEIAKANLWVLYLVFHPRLFELINPQLITFKTSLRSRLGQMMLANSITLTPGTITASIDNQGYMTVHAIDDHTAGGVPGEMEGKIARMLGEA